MAETGDGLKGKGWGNDDYGFINKINSWRGVFKVKQVLIALAGLKFILETRPKTYNTGIIRIRSSL